MNIPVAPVGASKNLVTDQDVKEAIMRAATSLRWSIRDQAAGKLVATKTEKDQTAIVNIGYQMSMYSIRYGDSRNLGYRRKPMSDMRGAIHDPEYATIDMKYNDWVHRLHQAVQRELVALP